MLARMLSRGPPRRCMQLHSILGRPRRLVAHAAQVEVVESTSAEVGLADGVRSPQPPSNDVSAAAAVRGAQLEAATAVRATTSGAGSTTEGQHATSHPGSSGSPDGSGSAAKVADLDAQRFRLHPSVYFWQEYESAINTAWVDTDFSNPGTALQHLITRAVGSSVWRDPQSAAYWTYHSARLSFFMGQAIAGLAAHHLSESLPPSLLTLAGFTDTASSGGDASSGTTTTSNTTSTTSSGTNTWASPDGRSPFQRILANPGPEFSSRIGEALATWQQDFDNIRAGYYPLPWDMTPTHRQNNPLFMLQRTAQSLAESTAVLRRRVRGRAQPLWLSSDLYPEYYTKTFHYQTDGWFSDRSARIYEHSTETLFLGRQDAMQRTSLLPLADFLREAEQAGRPAATLRLLEVAAGTGRFHTFIKDAFPDLPSVVSDLSPFYLARARENLAYWAATRGGRSSRGRPGSSGALGGVEGTGADFLQTAAEAIGAPNESFDIVVAVYLFHELPEASRAAAAAEFFRVLRPGGLVVLTDSVQTGDRPAWDRAIGAFGSFNEPYYRSYLSYDLGALFESVGFVCDTKYVCSASKTLSFRKPAQLDSVLE